MVVENLSSLTNIETLEVLIKRVSTLTAIFQAIGGLILAYIIFNIINTIIAKKKRDELKRMRVLLERIDKNISVFFLFHLLP